jgi:hypothetical protein
MAVERVNCTPDGDVTSLTQALVPLGASVTVTSESSSAVVVHLPDDEYREKQCRQIVEQWQMRERKRTSRPGGADQADRERV